MSAKESLEKISKEIPGAKISKMFGADCIKAPNGKAVCMVWKDDMVFKLTGDDEKEAMKMKVLGPTKTGSEKPPFIARAHLTIY